MARDEYEFAMLFEGNSLSAALTKAIGSSIIPLIVLIALSFANPFFIIIAGIMLYKKAKKMMPASNGFSYREILLNVNGLAIKQFNGNNIGGLWTDVELRMATDSKLILFARGKSITLNKELFGRDKWQDIRKSVEHYMQLSLKNFKGKTAASPSEINNISDLLEVIKQNV